MAATHARTLSGSRSLRPQLSRFFNEVAQARRRVSRFIGAAAALMPPMPDIFSSRFLARPRTPPVEPVTTPRTVSHSRFLPSKMPSRFLNQPAPTRPRIITRFLKRMAALISPVPDFFASRFFTKPRTPPRHLRPHWPRGKPRGPTR